MFIGCMLAKIIVKSMFEVFEDDRVEVCMKLYLAQHGLATTSQENAERPLNAQGREDTTRTAGFLSLFEKPKPTRIFHSGKLRAEQTANMFAEAWGRGSVQQAEGLSPADDPKYWLDMLSESAEDTMLVGHMPHLQRLVGLLLCNDKNKSPVLLRNSGVLCLQQDASEWQVKWYIYPALFYGEA